MQKLVWLFKITEIISFLFGIMKAKVKFPSLMKQKDTLKNYCFYRIFSLWQSTATAMHNTLKNNGFLQLIMQDYGFSVSYYRAPYLVDIDMVEGKRVLKLEDINENGKSWLDADVLSFNTGHWWSHKGSHQGCISFTLPI